MKSWTILGWTALLVLGASAVRADDRKDIEALYGKLKQALMANNADATLAMETPDFVATGADGRKMNGKQLAAQMKQQAALGKPRKMDIHLDKVNVKGKTASVTTTFSFESVITGMGGQAAPKARPHVMAMSGSIHNDLVKTPQGWKFKTMQEKAGKMTMDGKPFDPAMMAGGPPKPHKK